MADIREIGRMLAAKATLRKPVEHDELKLAEQRARGQRAKALLEDELLVEAFDKIEKVYTVTWRATAPDDIDTRERAYQMLALLGDVKTALREVASTGAVAAETLERLSARR